MESIEGDVIYFTYKEFMLEVKTFKLQVNKKHAIIWNDLLNHVNKEEIHPNVNSHSPGRGNYECALCFSMSSKFSTICLCLPISSSFSTILLKPEDKIFLSLQF